MGLCMCVCVFVTCYCSKLPDYISLLKYIGQLFTCLGEVWME